MIGVTLGTGLGSGFVAGGVPLYSGAHVPQDGQLWHTPYTGGIAEDAVSTRALSSAYAERTGQQRTPVELALLAQTGDADALAVYADFGTHLARILAPWLRSFQPTALVFGGNIARSWPLFEPTLSAALPAETSIKLAVIHPV
ncbi:MAG: ROK family protein [Chloroflexaceae bacterium]|nr:ROK family protein [Chloroflexaceae bacterium]